MSANDPCVHSGTEPWIPAPMDRLALGSGGEIGSDQQRNQRRDLYARPHGSPFLRLYLLCLRVGFPLIFSAIPGPIVPFFPIWSRAVRCQLRCQFHACSDDSMDQAARSGSPNLSRSIEPETYCWR